MSNPGGAFHSGIRQDPFKVEIDFRASAVFKDNGITPIAPSVGNLNMPDVITSLADLAAARAAAKGYTFIVVKKIMIDEKGNFIPATGTISDRANALTTVGSVNTTVVDINFFSAVLLAHEFGHALGLKHRGNRVALMHPNAGSGFINRKERDAFEK